MYPYESFGRLIASRPAAVWLFGRRAPSLSFYASRTVESVAEQTALSADIGRGGRGWLVVTREDWAWLSTTDGAIRNRRGQVSAEGGRLILVRFGSLADGVDQAGGKDWRCDRLASRSGESRLRRVALGRQGCAVDSTVVASIQPGRRA